MRAPRLIARKVFAKYSKADWADITYELALRLAARIMLGGGPNGQVAPEIVQEMMSRGDTRDFADVLIQLQGASVRRALNPTRQNRRRANVQDEPKG